MAASSPWTVVLDGLRPGAAVPFVAFEGPLSIKHLQQLCERLAAPGGHACEGIRLKRCGIGCDGAALLGGALATCSWLKGLGLHGAPAASL